LSADNLPYGRCFVPNTRQVNKEKFKIYGKKYIGNKFYMYHIKVNRKSDSSVLLKSIFSSNEFIMFVSHVLNDRNELKIS
jgi:hypothetical protein